MTSNSIDENNFCKVYNKKCVSAYKYNKCKCDNCLIYKRSTSLKKYGLDYNGYFTLLKKQGNKCAICFTERSSTSRSKLLAIDHDHKSNRLRGLLCTNCNLALGHLKDSPILAAQAILYLIDNKDKTFIDLLSTFIRLEERISKLEAKK